MNNRLPPAWSKHLKVASGPKASPIPMAKPPIVKTAPNAPSDDMLLRQALEFQKAGQFPEAESLCHRVLARAPNHSLALYILGTLGLDFDDDLAIKYLARAAAQEPNNPHYQLTLGEAWLKVGDFLLAIKHLKRACELKPDLLEAICRLGEAYTKFDQAEMALPAYEKALKIDSNSARARTGLAKTLMGLGRMEEAAESLNETIARRLDVAEAYNSLVSTRKFSTEAPELNNILSELGDPTVSGEAASMLHLAAGKILNDLARYDEAMDHFQQAARIRVSDKAYDFDIDSYRRRVDALINLFDPKLIAAKAGHGDPSDVPVFVLGMPRSGTTLTEQICSSHPAVDGAGEVNKLKRMATALGLGMEATPTFGRQLRSMTEEKSRAMANEYVANLKQYSATAPYIIDKMPHNFENIGLIGFLFPNARIIHCTRDAIDNCLSCFMSNLNDSHSYRYDLRLLGLYYRQYDRLMRHWMELFPGRIFENRYEALISDQEGQSRRLIDYLGLPWDDACLRFFDKSGSVRTLSRWQVRQPIYASSVKRWKKYGRKIQPLIDALGDLAEL
ncbi:tetratricopeptide repeat-containing sulfotransferase family protein [Mesorhizobium sp. INR15]|uniref:tetratricopeptide repeat-containing sulfotransferase family protein n=1 Tax=Mesorhizobium sp. INR15 TaxID=2654248 RepID=UPI00189647B4|nr:tetratricopeptide repeat-containing sulfotransferase family protein [Mesorhizobium sp. INR15]QPC93987.1 tetratricopeptide repeat protein [Mesorhizobium sp. INR15]